jgi:hypothetical protein
MKTKPQKIEYTDTIIPDTIMSKTARGDVYRRSPGMPILLSIASNILSQNLFKNVSPEDSIMIAKSLIDSYNKQIDSYMDSAPSVKPELNYDSSTKCVLSGE